MLRIGLQGLQDRCMLLELPIIRVIRRVGVALACGHIAGLQEDIQTANSQFETGSFIRTLISYVVGIVLLVVAGFGIYNILNMMIYEKMDSIAIMKAIGFSGKDVNLIFIFIALIYHSNLS